MHASLPPESSIVQVLLRRTGLIRLFSRDAFVPMAELAMAGKFFFPQYPHLPHLKRQMLRFRSV